MDDPKRFVWDEVADSLDTRCAEERGLMADILCASCKKGHLFRRRGKLDVTVRCHNGDGAGIVVPADIVECSEYESKAALSMYDLVKLAYVIDPRTGVNDKAYL